VLPTDAPNRDSLRPGATTYPRIRPTISAGSGTTSTRSPAPWTRPGGTGVSRSDLNG